MDEPESVRQVSTHTELGPEEALTEIQKTTAQYALRIGTEEGVVFIRHISPEDGVPTYQADVAVHGLNGRYVVDLGHEDVILAALRQARTATVIPEDDSDFAVKDGGTHG